VRLRPSRRLSCALAALAVAASVAIFSSTLPFGVQLALGATLWLHLSYLLRRHRRSGGWLAWRGEHWSWRDADGREHLLHLRQATLWPGLIALRCTDLSNGRVRVFPLLVDSLDRDAQRQLRIALRHLPVFTEKGEDGGAVAAPPLSGLRER
jgi:hypothetical protein